ncbi:MAG: phosphatase PAP2 family protein [Catalinimonas sp.]
MRHYVSLFITLGVTLLVARLATAQERTLPPQTRDERRAERDSLSRVELEPTAFGRVPDPFFRRLGDDAVDMADAIWYTYKRPLSWDKKNWITFGAVMGGAALISLVDEPFRDWLQQYRDPNVDEALAQTINLYGKPNYNYPILAVIYGSGVAFNQPWLRETGTMLIASATASGIIQTYSKILIGRARPKAEVGAFDFKPLSVDIPNYHSFPSGHMALATATAYVFGRQAKSTGLKIFFYSLSAGTAFTRLYIDAHWASDVFLGAALSAACAEAVVHRVRARRYQRNQHRKVEAMLLPAPGGASLVVRFN